MNAYVIALAVIAGVFLGVAVVVTRLVVSWIKGQESEMAQMMVSCLRCGKPWALCQCGLLQVAQQPTALGQIPTASPTSLIIGTSPGLTSNNTLGAGQFYGVKAEDRAEPVYGWRSYALNTDNILQGMREPWPERGKTAICIDENVAQLKMQIAHLLQDDVAYRFWLERKGLANDAAERCRLHLEKGECFCGIYLRAKPEPFLGTIPIVAKALAYGVVACDEDGNARASDVQIESLYVVRLVTDGLPLAEYIDWERVANVLRGRYGVPVTVVGSVDELTEVTA